MKPSLVDLDMINRFSKNPSLIDIESLNIEIPRVNLETKESRSLLLNWVSIFIILFIFYLLYRRFKNTVHKPHLELLPPSIKNNEYHRNLGFNS